MRHTTFPAAAMALAAFGGLANAQTFSECNPVEGDECDPNPAFGGESEFDFRSASSVSDLEDFFRVDGGILYSDDEQVVFDDDTGMGMIIQNSNNAPTLISHDYIFFGRVEVEMQAAPGQGIISSIVLQSDSLDEIDWEFVGNDQENAQTNYFSQGVENFTFGRYHELDFNPMEGIHTYTIDWNPDRILFSIDGDVVREASADEGSYPQTPCQVRLGIWPGGIGNHEGTIEWAGGRVQWDDAPFSAYYRSIRVEDYGGGYEGALQYEYTNTDGTWDSIRVSGGSEVGFPDSDTAASDNQREMDAAASSSISASASSARESVVSSISSASATVTPTNVVTRTPIESASATTSLDSTSVSASVSSALSVASSLFSSASSVEETATASPTTEEVTATATATEDATVDEDDEDEDEDEDEDVDSEEVAGASSLQKCGLALGLAFVVNAMML